MCIAYLQATQIVDCAPPGCKLVVVIARRSRDSVWFAPGPARSVERRPSVGACLGHRAPDSDSKFWEGAEGRGREPAWLSSAIGARAVPNQFPRRTTNRKHEVNATSEPRAPIPWRIHDRPPLHTSAAAKQRHEKSISWRKALRGVLWTSSGPQRNRLDRRHRRLGKRRWDDPMCSAMQRRVRDAKNLGKLWLPIATDGRVSRRVSSHRHRHAGVHKSKSSRALSADQKHTRRTAATRGKTQQLRSRARPAVLQ